jgi:hypothetical protein
MMIQLELTPSMTGWYYAAGSAQRLAVREVPVPRPPRPMIDHAVIAPQDVCLGYGSDGRPRLASNRPGIWFLA